MKSREPELCIGRIMIKIACGIMGNRVPNETVNLAKDISEKDVESAIWLLLAAYAEA